MTEDERRLKREHEDIVRCANFLLQMIEKYGAEVMAEKTKKEKESKKEA